MSPRTAPKKQANNTLPKKKAPVRTSWKKGQTGNPNGRPPKGYSITEYFQEMFGANPEVKEALAKAILTKALRGDVTAQKLLWSYMDGQPPQTIKHSGVIGSLDFSDSGDALKTLFTTYEQALKNST